MELLSPTGGQVAHALFKAGAASSGNSTLRVLQLERAAPTSTRSLLLHAVARSNVVLKQFVKQLSATTARFRAPEVLSSDPSSPGPSRPDGDASRYLDPSAFSSDQAFFDAKEAAGLESACQFCRSRL